MTKRSLKAGSLLGLPATVLVVLGFYLFGAIPYRLYVVHTGSMSPTIPSKSVVVVRENRYRVGQVITFRENGSLVTHRLMSINADGTINTKGDADSSIDPWHVPTRNIIGGVVLAPHLVGFFLVYLKTPLGAASVVLSMLFAWQTWGLLREFDDKSGKRPPPGSLASSG